MLFLLLKYVCIKYIVFNYTCDQGNQVTSLILGARSKLTYLLTTHELKKFTE